MRKIIIFLLLILMSITYVAPAEGQKIDSTNNFSYVPMNKIMKDVIQEDNSSENSILDRGVGLQIGKEKYTNSVVNVRKDNNKKSKIITTLDPNTEVTSYTHYKGWTYISLDDDVYGYIKSEYLSDKQTPIEKLNRWNINLSKNEIKLLAKILFLEAGGESYKGQVAVVECVFNRMIDEYFKGTLYEVLSKKGQFVTWKNRNNATPTAENYEAIYDVLNGKTSVLEKNYLYFSRGGHTSHNGMIKIGNHQFCKKG